MQGLLACTPLQHAGHLSIMVDGASSRSGCRSLSHLEFMQASSVWQQSGIPIGSKWGLGTTRGSFSPTVDLGYQVYQQTCHIAGKSSQNHSWRQANHCSPAWSSILTSTPHSVTEYPSDIATRLPACLEEIERLFSSTMLDASGQPSIQYLPLGDQCIHGYLTLQWLVRGKVPSNSGEIVPVYLKQPPPSPQEPSQAGMADMSWPIPAAPPPPYQALQRGTVAPLPSNHRPILSPCLMMCCTSKRR